MLIELKSESIVRLSTVLDVHSVKFSISMLFLIYVITPTSLG